MKISQKAALLPALETALKDLGAKLARLRVARGLPQRLAAERAGISRNTMSRIENGDPSVSIGQVVRYLAVVDQTRALVEALQTEADPAVRGLAAREKTKRARALSDREMKRYDF